MLLKHTHSSTNVTGYFDGLASSSYTIYDSGYTKQYDKYNDVYRWVPLCGHIAGACARTDYLEDPWWSPAGVARGQIRGSVALAYNPTLSQRDDPLSCSHQPSCCVCR